MVVFKKYDGTVIDMPDHIHAVEDTLEEREVPAAGTTEFINTSNINLNYYSTALTATVTSQTLGSRTIYSLGTSYSSALNGNIVLKAQLSTALTPGNSYIMYLEAVEDTNTKTDIISMDFGINTPYDYNSAFYLTEPIRRPVEGFGNNILFMSKITPEDTIKSLLLQLYITTKINASTKNLLKLSIKQLSYTTETTTGISTITEPGFMSVEDKFKLEDINDKSDYIENKLESAIFYNFDGD